MTNAELNDLLGQAEEHNKIGRYAEAEELASRAVSELARTLALHNAQGDNKAELFDDMRESDTLYSRALAASSESARRRGDYNRALELALHSLDHAEGAKLAQGAARARVNVGNVHLRLGSYDKALEYYTLALAAYEELGDKTGVALVGGNIGVVHQRLGSYDKALSYFVRSLSILEELGDKSEVARATTNIAKVYFFLGSYDKALEHCARSLSVFDELGNMSGVAQCTATMGNVHDKLGSHDKAFEYYMRALSAFEELGDKLMIATVTGNIGNVYKHLNSFDKALEYYTRCLAACQELGDKSGVASANNNIGLIHTRLGSYDKALEYVESSLSAFEELGDMSAVAVATGNIGTLYAIRQYAGYDAAKAETCLRRALELGSEIGFKGPIMDFHKDLSDLYEQEGRDKEALAQFKKHIELKEEINAEEVRKQDENREREKQIALANVAADARLKGTEELLFKVLPQNVASRMLRGERVADYFQHISIMFADIVGFTPIAARMPAKAVLAFLNYVFGEFDRIIKKHGCQKIKTIGDGYMAVCGAPVECSDHAERLTRAAVELMNDIALPESIRSTLPRGSVFHLRIGLHTGSAFAGIVGEEGFVYDVYSDAVNLAARMESSGEPGRIHCSEDFALHLQNRDESFAFEERGEMEIKGKGVMRTYFLEKR